jgi:hypothetical protein
MNESLYRLEWLIEEIRQHLDELDRTLHQECEILQSQIDNMRN